MFNFEQSIVEWRKQMLATGIKGLPLEELESHLREELDLQMHAGLDAPLAFAMAVKQIGKVGKIKAEFSKIAPDHWNYSLARMAWGLFLISFFLPAYAGGRGWQCAGLSITALSWYWADFPRGSWGSIFLFSLTLANLVMLASPFLLVGFGQKPRALKWPRFLILGAGVLVWSYVGELIIHDAHDLEIGCYAWGLSFLLLYFSTWMLRAPKSLGAQYV
ncbi:MAG TPA: hypothetical protein VMH87_12155 [Pseudomonadales bacterium]|nr:hypothetical protein [Pseudomonadales bacterium]